MTRRPSQNQMLACKEELGKQTLSGVEADSNTLLKAVQENPEIVTKDKQRVWESQAFYRTILLR